MKKAGFILFLLFSCRAYSQSDLYVVKSGIAVNAGELIDFIRWEYNFRLAYEQKVISGFSVLGEGGVYFTGSGYNYKLEIKKYLLGDNFDFGGETETGFIAIDYFQKDHSYYQQINYYTDTTRTTTANNRTFVDKISRDAHIVIGITSMSVRKRWSYYVEGYVGLGVRFKTINGISAESFKLMESEAVDLKPYSNVLPDITCGLRLGYDFHRHRKK